VVLTRNADGCWIDSEADLALLLLAGRRWSIVLLSSSLAVVAFALMAKSSQPLENKPSGRACIAPGES
jgi:hypothetical protein